LLLWFLKIIANTAAELNLTNLKQVPLSGILKKWNKFIYMYNFTFLTYGFFSFFFLQGSELAYIYACVFLGFIPIVCAGAGYGVVKLQNRRRRRLRMRQEELKNNAGGKISVDKMAVREWLHANHRRLVIVKFGPEAAIHTVDRKGEKLRTVNFRTSEALTVEESQVRSLTSHKIVQCVPYTGMC
jgi:hypothetical protein